MDVSKKRKNSKQRDAILSLLRERTDHPNADTIYQELRQTMPNISLGTVYRNLTLLADTGQILRLSCDGKIDRFDGNYHPHYHFMCNECGNVYDLKIAYDEDLNTTAQNNFPGQVQSHFLLYYGKCNHCLEKE